jgi:hypothetical protein
MRASLSAAAAPAKSLSGEAAFAVRRVGQRDALVVDEDVGMMIGRLGSGASRFTNAIASGKSLKVYCLRMASPSSVQPARALTRCVGVSV